MSSLHKVIGTKLSSILDATTTAKNTSDLTNTDAHSNNDVEGNKYKVKEFKLVSNVSSAMEDAQKLPNQLVVGQNVLKKNASMNNVINNDNVNISSTSSTLDSYKAKSLSANR